MPKFRKKPVVIEAIKWTGFYDDATREKDLGNFQELLNWASPTAIYIEHDPSGDFCLAIPTLEGTMYASYGDWIIKGVQGEFYPCKPNIFKATYEEVR